MLQAATELRDAPIQRTDEAHDRSTSIGEGALAEHAALPRVQVGDWIEVRGKAEILATLDERGRLDGLPFMPQMLEYCGQRFQVHKRAHKTCDTSTGVYVGRSLPDGIHLDLRCDGSAHGGCQAGCLLFWKEAWIKPVDAAAARARDAAAGAARQPVAASGTSCTEQDVREATRRIDDGAETRYVCQATELLQFTRPLKWWDPRQYAEDYRSGNEPVGKMASVLIYATYVFWTRANSRKWGAPGRWLYDSWQSIWGGQRFPRHKGTIPVGSPTPRQDANLQAGEWVRVKSYADILATLNEAGTNRSMTFDGEMVPYCGRIFQVRTRVERFIDEGTGRIKSLKTPAVILEGAYCQARYSHHRLLCPRSIFSWWRENWLERIDPPTITGQAATDATGVRAGDAGSAPRPATAVSAH